MTTGLWSTLRTFLDFPALFAPRAARWTDRSQPAAPRTVLVLGPATEAYGGMAAVLKVLTENWSPDRYRMRHIVTHVDGSRRAKLAAAVRGAREMLSAILTRRACAVHVHFAARGSFYRKSAFILMARALGVPVVGHAHSGLFPGFYEGGSRLRRAYVRFVLNRLDRLVVLSEEWADYYRGLYTRSAPVVVPNPAVLPAPATPRPARSGPVLLSLGRLGPGKGTYDILQVVPGVLRHFPRAQFWFGGDGELDEVRRRLQGKPWASRVRLLGWVSGAEKDAAMRAADVFLLPSYAEGLPMALLEAMAHGLPVVTTPVGGIPRAVENGRTGLLIRPGDVPALQGAILSLLRRPAEAAAMGEAARRVVVENYAMASVQARLTALYDELPVARHSPLLNTGRTGDVAGQS
ncbi:glycosyltransferase family 4 protein [Azospirillum halopraeferens]|uniref:glycosyltransferase family 4 protein n=1 Tax=Azospirillum halopraeferens TaxID=34010 RepID=UPI0003F91D08|nr:glycosyltransferase family 4 protein [Azospirillum halopraeferens]